MTAELVVVDRHGRELRPEETRDVHVNVSVDNHLRAELAQLHAAVGAKNAHGNAHGEQRDPRGATQLTQWQSPNLVQVQEWHAQQAWRLGVLANVIAYRCVQLRARAAAAIPLVAGRKLGDPKTINDKALITQLLGPPPGGPAPKLSASKLFRWTHAQKIVTGRRAWEIETAPGSDVPVAFWPLVSADLREKPSRGGTGWFRVFEYGAIMDPISFTPDQVFYGWEPSGLNFRQAESELQSARYDLSLVTMADRYGISFLRNNAVPAAIVTTTAFPNAEAKRRFEQNWASEYGGPDNAGRVVLNEVGDDGDGPVGDSIDIKVLGLSAKDSRLVESRKESMMEIAIALGTPWSKLDASGRTFDNAEVEDRSWYEETILPDLIELQEDINMQLAGRLGTEVVWFDLRQVRALHRKILPVTAGATAPQLVQSQLMWINEARADYGLEPVPDGDRFMTAEEIAALKAGPAAAAQVTGLADPALSQEPGAVPLDQQKPTAIPGKGLPKALPAGTPPSANDPKLNADQPAKGNLAGRVETRMMSPEQTEQRRALIWHQSDAAVRTLEGRWERAWRRMFNRQAEATVARLTGKRGRQLLERRDGEPAPLIDPAAVFDVAFWRAQSVEASGDLYDEVIAASLSALAARFGLSFDLSAPWVEQFIEHRVQQLAGQVTQTTYDQIRFEMIEGVRLGESIDDIATRIRSVFHGASTVRATMIARTEVISAYNGAAALGAVTLPADVVAGQEWIATRDARTREAHAAADGQTVAIGQPFSVGGADLAYPGDPNGGARNTVNCFPAATIVSSVEVEGSYRRWYEGDMVTVRTRSGRILSGTPNHPVLTHRGWVALGELNVRDQLVAASVCEFRGASWIEPHVHRAPTSIGQIHDALALVGAPHGVAGAPVDFHGDGTHGQVDVVRANGLLRVGDHALVEEQRSKLDFAKLDLLERALSDARLQFKFRWRGLGPTTSDVRGEGETFAFGGVGGGHADDHRGGPAAGLDAGIDQPTSDASTSDVEAGGKGLLGLSGQVALDEIVDIEVEAFAGHVFNLQTASGWYIANGIVTHNCRCTVAFLTPDEMAASTAVSAKQLEVRVAKALLALVPVGADGFDFIAWRRAAEEVAA